jgi:hypothetical protein
MGVDSGVGTSPNRGVPFNVPGYTAQYKPAGNVHRWLYTNVPKLSTNQVAQILYQVGFRGNALVAFLAVAMRESGGGSTWIVGDPTGGASHEYSIGIFGLNTLGNAWNEMKKMVSGLTDRSQLLNPVVGAMVALKMYQKYGERPWRVANGTWNPNGSIFGGTMGQAAAQRAVQAAEKAGLFRTPFMDPRWNFNVPYGLVPSNPSGSHGAGTPASQPGTGGAVSVGADTRPGSPGVATGVVAAPLTPDTRYAGYGGYAPQTQVTPAPAELSPAELKAFIAENYGYMVGFMNHPEVGPILVEAARAGWSRDRLYGRLSQTNWWKTTNDAVRKWDALAAEDPATTYRLRAEKEALVRNLAFKAGLELTNDEITGLNGFAALAVRQGWTDAQLKDQIAAQAAVRWGGKPPTAGDPGHAVQMARKMAADYYVSVSDAELSEFGRRLIAEETSEEDMRARFAARARSKYASNPGIINMLDRGLTLSDAFAGHQAQIARLLEVSPESIDLTSDAWQGVLQHPDKGVVRPMTITEASRMARGTEAYMKTDNGRRAAMAGLSTLKKAFGF